MIWMAMLLALTTDSPLKTLKIMVTVVTVATVDTTIKAKEICMVPNRIVNHYPRLPHQLNHKAFSQKYSGASFGCKYEFV